MMRRRYFACRFALIGACALWLAGAAPPTPQSMRGRAQKSDVESLFPVRGVTIGPIENALHPERGYGSEPFGRAVDEAAHWGATWVALTPFGRVHDLRSQGVDPTFEAPPEENRRAFAKAVRQAHQRGLRVLLVPHLWVESGEWRALIDPGTDAGWAQWAQSYGRFALGWAEVAEASGVDMMAAGVELRSWVTTARAPSFARLVAQLREVYTGPLTYSGNWDDVEHTVIYGDLDAIGINAFYPLGYKDGATPRELWEGGERVRVRVHALAQAWGKPVYFSEMGYTTRSNPAIKPWEWPDGMKNVRVDQDAQAQAYRALLGPLLSEPLFQGFFVWRTYADPDDASQEAEWGFSPRGKQAERVLRDVYRADWARDAVTLPGLAPQAPSPGHW